MHNRTGAYFMGEWEYGLLQETYKSDQDFLQKMDAGEFEGSVTGEMKTLASTNPRMDNCQGDFCHVRN